MGTLPVFLEKRYLNFLASFELQELLLSCVLLNVTRLRAGSPSWEMSSVKFLFAFLSSCSASIIILKILLLIDLCLFAFDPYLPNLFLMTIFLSAKLTCFLFIVLHPDFFSNLSLSSPSFVRPACMIFLKASCLFLF